MASFKDIGAFQSGDGADIGAFESEEASTSNGTDANPYVY